MFFLPDYNTQTHLAGHQTIFLSAFILIPFTLVVQSGPNPTILGCMYTFLYLTLAVVGGSMPMKKQRAHILGSNHE
jgi:hypothetical protein